MIAKLAVKDIMHELLISLCLVLAISSIIAPLLILFGLKYGTIQTMRQRLIQDPKNREIRPLSSASFSKDWFEKLTTYKGIAFVVPMTRQISSTVDVSSDEENSVRLSILATSYGDPLLLENDVKIPDENSCVITKSAAENLAVDVGDDIILSVRRITNGKNESGTFSARVTGILKERASTMSSVFLNLSILEAIEDFKDGRAVPKYGWPGKAPVAYPVYDGAAVLTRQPLSKLEEIKLLNNTGFTRIRRVSKEEELVALGYKLKGDGTVYLISTKQQVVEKESIEALNRRLRGKNAYIIPWVKNISAELIANGNKQTLIISITSIDIASAEKISPFMPPAKLSQISSDKQKRFIIVPETMHIPEGPAVLKLNKNSRELRIGVEVHHGFKDGERIYAPLQFTALLNLFLTRDISYERETDSLLLSRRGYAGFRMYTETIDDVVDVQRDLESMGVAVHTQAARILEVRRLNSYLTLIFWLIAAVGVIGGIAALTASLYAAVERKKKELNILRLLGFRRVEIVRFPIYQAFVFAGTGLIIASGLFIVVSNVINTLFKSHLKSTESLCFLSTYHFFALIVSVLLLSGLAASFASIRATRMDPAEALRDE